VKGEKKKYIEMFGSFTEPFNYLKHRSSNSWVKGVITPHVALNGRGYPSLVSCDPLQDIFQHFKQ